MTLVQLAREFLVMGGGIFKVLFPYGVMFILLWCIANDLTILVIRKVLRLGSIPSMLLGIIVCNWGIYMFLVVTCRTIHAADLARRMGFSSNSSSSLPMLTSSTSPSSIYAAVDIQYSMESSAYALLQCMALFIVAVLVLVTSIMQIMAAHPACLVVVLTAGFWLRT